MHFVLNDAMQQATTLKMQKYVVYGSARPTPCILGRAVQQPSVQPPISDMGVSITRALLAGHVLACDSKVQSLHQYFK